ncbi:MAG TPA: TolC family protein, partial [Polyangia bacterium]|nr:TolC family protein [Polyangia bacterium]
MSSSAAVVLAAAVVALPARPARAAPTLTLGDAIRAARAHHPTVEAQRGQVLVARGRGEQAFAPLLPYLTGSVGYQPQTANLVATPPLQQDLLSSAGTDTAVDTRGMATVVTCRTPGVGNCAPIPPAPTSWALYNFWSLSVGATWKLWDWGQSLYNLRAARAQAAAAEVGVRTAQHDVVLDAKLAFFGAVAADEQLAVAREAVETYRVHVVQTRAFHDEGLRTGIDVATAESALAAAAITLARAQAAVASARAQLAQAMGEERGGDWILVAQPSVFEVTREDEHRVATTADALADTA